MTGERRLNQSMELVSLVLVRVVSFDFVVAVVVVDFVFGTTCFGVTFFRRSSARRFAAATASLRDLGVFRSGVSNGGGGGGGTIVSFGSFSAGLSDVALSEARTDLAS